jgi:hypothetical protein
MTMRQRRNQGNGDQSFSHRSPGTSVTLGVAPCLPYPLLGGPTRDFLRREAHNTPAVHCCVVSSFVVSLDPGRARVTGCRHVPPAVYFDEQLDGRNGEISLEESPRYVVELLGECTAQFVEVLGHEYLARVEFGGPRVLDAVTLRAEFLYR